MQLFKEQSNSNIKTLDHVKGIMALLQYNLVFCGPLVQSLTSHWVPCLSPLDSC